MLIVSHVREKKERNQKQREDSSTTKQLRPQEYPANNSQTPTTLSSHPVLSGPSTSLPLQSQLVHTRTATSESQYTYQIPPPAVPIPFVQGMPTQHYPSQATHAIMGGAFAHPFNAHRQIDFTSRHHSPDSTPTSLSNPTLRSRKDGERERASERKCESNPSVATAKEMSREGRLYDASGLSTSQRVTAFLSTSSHPAGISSTDTCTAEQKPVQVKEKAHEKWKSDRITTALAYERDSASIPVPSEGYLPVSALPPLQVSNLATGSKITKLT